MREDDRQDLGAVLRGEIVYESHFRRSRRKDGAIVWTEQRNLPVYDEEGKLAAIEGVARDLTAPVEAQDRLAAQDRPPQRGRPRLLVPAIPRNHYGNNED